MSDPFELSKLTRDEKRGAALTTGGAAAITVGTNQNRIGIAAARSHQAIQGQRLKRVNRKMAQVKASKITVPRNSELSRGAARRQALAGRSAKIRQLQGKANKINHIARKAPKIQRAVAERSLAAGLLVGVPLTYAGAQKFAEKDRIKKYTKRELDAAAGGAAAGAVGYHTVGYGSKPLERKLINAKIAADPELTAKYKAHKTASGIGRNTPSGSKEWLKFFRKYPKDLPGAKFKRALSVTHGGKAGLATQGVVVTGAGAAAVHHAHKQKVRKDLGTVSAFGVDHV